jgi:hypothetical protein
MGMNGWQRALKITWNLHANLKVGEMEIGDCEGVMVGVSALLTDVRHLLWVTKFSTAEIPPMSTSPSFPLHLVGTFCHSHDASR